MVSPHNREQLKPVLAWLDAHREEAIADLQRFCQQPSVAAQNWGMQEMATLVVAALNDLGAEAQLVPTSGYPVAVGQLAGSSARRLMIYDHYDVQPPDPLEDWISPPFEAAIRENTLYARGVADNKGNLVARLWAARAWLAVHKQLPCSVTFLFEGEEEVGSPHLGEFAAANQGLLKVDGCLWESGYRDADGSLTFNAGAKGLLYVEMSTRGVGYDLHSSNAPIAPSAAWRLLEALRSLRDPSGHILIPHFYDDVLPPTARERELLERFPIDVEERRTSWEAASLPGPVDDPVAMTQRLLYEPTCNICGLYSGYSGPGSKTILPATAGAKLDFRLVPKQNPDTILALLREHLHAQGFDDVEVRETEQGEFPAQSPVDTPLMAALIRAASFVYGREPRVLPRTAGTGPVDQLCIRYGIPIVNGAGVGNANSRIHSPNENVKLEDYILGIKLVATLFSEYTHQ